MNDLDKKLPIFKWFSVTVLVLGLVWSGWYILSTDLLVDRNPYELSLEDYNRIDPDLIRYQQTQAVNIPGQRPRALCVDSDDNIFVAVDSTVIKFNAFGSVEKVFSVGAPVNCLTISTDGELYLGYKSRIAILDQVNQSITGLVDLLSTSHLTSLAVDHNYIFAADAGMRIVHQFDHRGGIVRTLGGRDNASGRLGFIVPSPFFDLAIESKGQMWVVNPGQHVIEKYRADGELVSQWGERSPKLKGFCGCCNPTHIAFLPDGRFVTSEKGLVRVKLYTSNGEFDRVVAGPKNFSRNAIGLDLAVDSNSRILVLDPGAQQVRIFQPKEAM